MADRTLSDNPQTSGALFALPSGFVIKDRYEIRRILGMGGFAITYQAFDFKLNGPVAVKEYFPQQ